ncbi:MAG: P-loop NTPase [Chlamydiales bacterium]
MNLKLYKKSSIHRCLAVAAGKGGVGKSAIAVQLALAAHRRGERVALIDADLYGPSIRQMLPEAQLPFKRDGELFPAVAQGMKLLSFAHVQEGSLCVRAPIVHQIIEQFFHQVSWGEVDTLFVDFPPGTGDIHLSLVDKAKFDGAILVTTPSEIALADVEKAYQFFQKVGVPVVGVVENMSYLEGQPNVHPFGSGGGERFAVKRRIPFLGKVPLDPHFSVLLDTGRAAEYDNPLFEKIINRLQTELLCAK